MLTNTPSGFDTLIKHEYVKSGVYNLNVMAAGKGKNSVLNIPVTVLNRKVTFPLGVGMVWRYRLYEYRSECGVNPCRGKYRYGIHTWEIISMSVTGRDTIFKVRESIQDTAESSISWWSSDSTRKVTLDSIISRTTYFNITKNDSIYYENFNIKIPNQIEVDSLPFKPFENRNMYFDVYGFKSTRSSFMGNGWSSGYSLELIDFRKPGAPD